MLLLKVYGELLGKVNFLIENNNEYDPGKREIW